MLFYMVKYQSVGSLHLFFGFVSDHWLNLINRNCGIFKYWTLDCYEDAAEERRLSMKPEMIWSRHLTFQRSRDNFVWNDLPLLMKHGYTIRNQRPYKSLVRVVDDWRNSGYNKNQQERLWLWVLKTRRLFW